MGGAYWYPSIGNKEYPYTDWQHKHKEWAWTTLEILAEAYHGICKVLRKQYKWSPLITDNISIQRLQRIYDETLEDAPEKIGEDDEFD